jgi:Flp pilus assembly pilin Flp
MKGASRLPASDSESGAYKMGYAIIAAAMALALFATIPLVAGSLPRVLQLISSTLGATF